MLSRLYSMTVLNIHKRKIHKPKELVSQIFRTLATQNDLIWPGENWPAIRFRDGLKVGSKGGHGRIRYTIIDFQTGESIKFQFSKPDGFNGTHEFAISKINDSETAIEHIISAKLSLRATLLWVFVIRWLHDALIEDAFDKVENQFTEQKTHSEYNLWVKLLREVYKR